MSSCKVIYLKKKKEFKEDIPNLPQIVVRTIFREVVGGVAGRGSHGYTNISGIVTYNYPPQIAPSPPQIAPSAKGHRGPKVLNTQSPTALKHSSPNSQTHKP